MWRATLTAVLLLAAAPGPARAGDAGPRLLLLVPEGERLVARFEPVAWGLIGDRGGQRLTVDERAAAEDGLLVMFASNCAGYWAQRDSVSAATRAAR